MGASALPGLASGDRVTAVGDVAVANYTETADALAAAATGPVVVTFDRDGFLYTATVAGPIVLPDDGARGFLGIGPETPRVREDVVSATGEAVRTFGDVTVMSVQGLGRFFSPDGLSRYAELFRADGSEPVAPPSGSVTPVDPDAPVPQSSTASSSAGEEDRVLSILGVIRLGSQAADAARVRSPSCSC